MIWKWYVDAWYEWSVVKIQYLASVLNLDSVAVIRLLAEQKEHILEKVCHTLDRSLQTYAVANFLMLRPVHLLALSVAVAGHSATTTVQSCRLTTNGAVFLRFIVHGCW